MLSQDWPKATKLKSMRVAGDKLHFYPKKELPFTLYNLYGPTEATIWSTYSIVTPQDTKKEPSIGKPVKNVQLYVLDEDMKPCPIGVKGEIYIGGRGVGRGYLRRPDLNNDSFIYNPFVDEEGGRLYKTGDIGYYQSDHNIAFVGRKDYQVKIRGFRVELEEIETVFNQHPMIINSVVIAKEISNGQKRLIGYVVFSDEKKSLTEVELSKWLKDKLPDYMIPTSFVIMDKLPLASNGKVDRKGLPEPFIEYAERKTEYIPPRNMIEEKLTKIWSEVLDLKEVGINDTFFEVGGNSISGIQLISRIRKNFKIEIPVHILFELPNIAELAEYIRNSDESLKKYQDIKIERIERRENLPLAFAQERLWFFNMMYSNTSAYNIPIALRFSGRLNIQALREYQ